MAKTSAAAAALMCTTVPPAKSRQPSWCSQPPGDQTQCATGAYTTMLHRPTKRMYALIRTRSTIAPEIKAGVITANIAWKSMNAACGMVGARSFITSPPTPRRPA